jgi:hypothetical protein
MNSSRSVGLLLIGIGVLAILAGLLVWSGALAWFGRLPGDIRYERGSTRVYFPITSMILVSVVLTLVLNLLRRLF